MALLSTELPIPIWLRLHLLQVGGRAAAILDGLEDLDDLFRAVSPFHDVLRFVLTAGLSLRHVRLSGDGLFFFGSLDLQPR